MNIVVTGLNYLRGFSLGRDLEIAGQGFEPTTSRMEIEIIIK